MEGKPTRRQAIIIGACTLLGIKVGVDSSRAARQQKGIPEQPGDAERDAIKGGVFGAVAGVALVGAARGAFKPRTEDPLEIKHKRWQERADDERARRDHQQHRDD